MSSLVNWTFVCADRHRALVNILFANVVEAIPDDWGFFNGRLQAPANHLTAAHEVGLRLWRDFLEFVAPPVRGEPKGKAGYLEIALKRRPLGFVEFMEAGRGQPEEFLDIRRIVAQYLREDYLGCLSILTDFGSHLGARRADLVVEECVIDMQAERPSVSIRFDPDQGGQESRVERIVNACRQLELAEVRS